MSKTARIRGRLDILNMFRPVVQRKVGDPADDGVARVGSTGQPSQPVR
jgi:hypothetical protein